MFIGDEGRDIAASTSRSVEVSAGSESSHQQSAPLSRASTGQLTEDSVNTRQEKGLTVSRGRVNKQSGMASVENTLNSMTGDISLADLNLIDGISPSAMKAKSTAADISIFQKKDYSSSVSTDIVDYVCYHNITLLRRFVSETGKIVPIRISHIPKKKQKSISSAIKIARFLGLLPYVEY